MPSERKYKLASFNALYKQHKPPLLHYAMGFLRERVIAEEVVSDAFVKAWARRDEFVTDENTKAFLFVVTRNACLDYLKSKQRRISYDQDLLEELPHYTDIFISMVNAELLEMVLQEIDKLPTKQSEVLRLSFIEGLSTEEIYERMHTSASAVFANRSLGLQKLRSSLKGKRFLLTVAILELIHRF